MGREAVPGNGSAALIFLYVHGGHSTQRAGIARIQAALARAETAFLRSCRRDFRDSGACVAEFRLSCVDPGRGPLADRNFRRGLFAIYFLRDQFLSPRAFALD
jgi:hypothetical protein